MTIDHLWLGPEYSAEDFSGRFKVAWTEERLYILVEVVDDILFDSHRDPLVQYWDDDCVEIFIDEDYSGGDHQYNHNAFAYHMSLDNQAIDIGTDERPHNYSHHVESRWKQTGNKVVWEFAIDIYTDDYVDGCRRQRSRLLFTPARSWGSCSPTATTTAASYARISWDRSRCPRGRKIAAGLTPVCSVNCNSWIRNKNMERAVSAGYKAGESVSGEFVTFAGGALLRHSQRRRDGALLHQRHLERRSLAVRLLHRRTDGRPRIARNGSVSRTLRSTRFTRARRIPAPGPCCGCRPTGGPRLWEPFNRECDARFEVSRNLYKNTLGNKLCFEEVNHDLELTFRYTWMTSDQFGFVRHCELVNNGRQARAASHVLDGLQNMLPGRHAATGPDQHRATSWTPTSGRNWMRPPGLASLRCTPEYRTGPSPANR